VVVSTLVLGGSSLFVLIHIRILGNDVIANKSKRETDCGAVHIDDGPNYLKG